MQIIVYKLFIEIDPTHRAFGMIMQPLANTVPMKGVRAWQSDNNRSFFVDFFFSLCVMYVALTHTTKNFLGLVVFGFVITSDLLETFQSCDTDPGIGTSK
jgi:hypothetical protein